MRRLIYSTGVSLDGFIAGPHGEIDWSGPEEELHRFHNRQTRDLGAHLCIAAVWGVRRARSNGSWDRTEIGSRRLGPGARPARSRRGAHDAGGLARPGAGTDPLRVDARLAVHVLPRRRRDHGGRPRRSVRSVDPLRYPTSGAICSKLMPVVRRR